MTKVVGVVKSHGLCNLCDGVVRIEKVIRAFFNSVL